MDTPVDIAFDCLPLRSVGRVDVPLDASPEFRARLEHLKRAIDTHGIANAYFLYNSRCIYRLANSDIEGMLRFSFEGTVLTDLSDAKSDRADLAIELVSETCGSVPAVVLNWFCGAVERAVLVEFDRFIAAGHLAKRVDELERLTQLADLSGFAGMNL
ncbi:MAG: hypothetical protein WD971_03800 [Pirellulales bacterium]